MNADRIRRAFVPLSLVIFSVGIAFITIMEITAAEDTLYLMDYICIFIPAGVYSVISALALGEVISKDGATVLSILFIPVLVLFVFFFLMFSFPLGIRGIS